MKKLAVICLIASLSFPVGSVPVFAETADQGVHVVQTKDAGTESADQSSTGERVTTDNSEYDYPADWDPEDPQNARAYEQLMGASESQGGADASVLYDISTQAAAITTTWAGKTYTHNDFNAVDCDIVPCIDVSYHQGTIDWKKVKNAGIDYVILRAGYRASASGTLNKDKMFETYIKDAQKAGLKVGAYIYSQAISVEEAEAEANFILNRIKNYTIDLPVVFDYEYYGAQEGRLYNAHLSKSEKTKCAEAFCKKVSAAGYQAMVYANASFCESELDTAALHKKYQIWMARYNSYSYKESRDKGVRYGGQIDFWQCSESAKVDGIDSTSVDFNWWYKSKNAQAGSGVIYDSAMGAWVYQVNGKIDTDYTGVAYNSNGWWYVKNGKVDFTYTGLASNANGWWYVKNGKVDFTYTGLASNANGWWYVKNGQVDFKYNGFAENEYGWWYLEDGYVTLKKNSIEYGTVDKKTGWWHVKNSRVVYDTTVAENENGWWYVKDGKVDFAYDGLAENENGWWYVKDGKVDFVYDGLAENENGWWYVKNGQVDFKYNGFAENEYGWWYLEDGQVTFAKNGVEYGTVKGKTGWWHIKESQADLTYTGFASNENGDWYVENGQVTFAKDSIEYGTVKGKKGWWHIKGSQVVYDTTLAENGNGWWYVKNGQVDFKYNGFAENEYGWWYLEDGYVTLKKNSIEYGTVDKKTGWWHVKNSRVVYDTTVAENENGWWYVKDGKVDFAYDGLAENENGWWYLEGGQVTFQYTGIAENENGTWYVKTSQVDFTYSGTVVFDKIAYVIKNGKADASSTEK